VRQKPIRYITAASYPSITAAERYIASCMNETRAAGDDDDATAAAADVASAASGRPRCGTRS